METKHASIFSTICIAALVAGCGGGGSTPPTVSSGGSSASSSSSSPSLVLSIAGNTSLLNTDRRPQSLNGTTVNVLVNGVVVGTGKLGSDGKAIIALSSSVAPGTTVSVQVGSRTFTATLGSSSSSTDVSVNVNDDGSATVSMNDHANPAKDAATETEDQDGKPVAFNSGSQVRLPSNFPILISFSCMSMTIAPTPGMQLSRLIFKEKSSDSDSSANVSYDGSFSGPHTFSVDGQSARMYILVYDANGQLLLEMMAPLGSFTPETHSSPMPMCSQTPKPIPPVVPTWKPTGYPTWHPTMRPSFNPNDGNSPDAHPTPTITPTTRATGTPRPTPTPTAIPTFTATPTPRPTPTPTMVPTAIPTPSPVSSS